MKIPKYILIFGLIALGILAIVNRSFSSNANLANNNTQEPLLEYTLNSTNVIDTFMDNTFTVTSVSGTKMLDSNGNILWEKSIPLINPMTEMSDNYLITADATDGMSINVFDKKGFLYTLPLSYELSDFSVNNNGYVTSICVDTDGYIVTVYDDSGASILTKATYDDSLYAISADISNDNQILSLAQVNTAYLNLQSVLSFLYTEPNTVTEYTTESGEFSSQKIDNEVIGEVKFIGDNLMVITDMSIYVYEYKNDDFILKSNIVVDNYISNLCTIDDKYIAIALGLNKDSISPYSVGTLLIYDLDGNLVCEKTGDAPITSISPTKDSVIVCQDRYIYELDLEGNMIWDYTNNRDLNQAIYIGNDNSCILVEPDRIIPYYNITN